jgi:hypothetical protein
MLYFVFDENISIMVYFGGSAKLDRQKHKTSYPFEVFTNDWKYSV